MNKTPLHSDIHEVLVCTDYDFDDAKRHEETLPHYNRVRPLIAAAPDLLAACQRALERLNAANRDRTEKQGHFRNSDIESAIAKATGQPDNLTT